MHPNRAPPRKPRSGGGESFEATGNYKEEEWRRRPRKQGGWVSELEGISERGVEGTRRDQQARNGSRRTSRGLQDVQGRRKVASNRRELVLSRRDHCSPASRGTESPERAFPLANLEAYLKERGPASVVKESLGFSPTSSSRPLQYSSARLHKLPQQLKCSSNVSESSMPGKPRARITYGSANEAADSDETERSAGCGPGMPWPWPGNNGQGVSSSNPCFQVNNKRAARRKRINYKYCSERSVSSFDSDTDTVPLMTEPEPCHDCSDDLAGSSFNLGNNSRASRLRAKNPTRFSDGLIDTQGQTPDVVARKQSGNKNRSLSQKYRPKSFKEVIGQNMVVESLSNAILRAKIAPVYLFHGPRGTGKTTAAKIFTNAMNCLSIEELRPCGLCKECTAFHTGQNYDVKQVDAAGNNDLESMRLLLKLVSLPPSASRYKVMIIDDCHTLTAEAWNALLKSLEEPPSYVVFILITTDLEQLPRTAISRCQKFMFSRVKDADIVLRLRKLALQERVEIEPEALQFIASKSDGSFRDAENMLDQLSLLGKRITLATVQEMVGLIPDEKLAKLLDLALAGDTACTVNAIRQLMESGVEPLALTSQLATLITDILAGKDRAADNLVVKVRKEEQDRLKHVLVILSDAEKQLRSCSDRTTWLTAAFLQFASKELCLAPSSSRGTSVPQSPIPFVDTTKKETLESDAVTTRLSWGGNESRSLSRRDHTESLQNGTRLDGGLEKQTDNHASHASGPFGDNRVHPCDLSPQSRTSNWESQAAGYASLGTGNPGAIETGAMSPSTMDKIWRKVLQGSRANGLRQILQGKGKLVSLSVTEAYAVALLEFGHPQDKSMAERARPNIVNVFQLALGCPVVVEIGLLSPAMDLNLTGNHNRNCAPNFTDNQRKPINQEASLSRRTRGSFRKSSTSFRHAAASSPRHHNLEGRKSRQSFEMEVRTQSARSTDASRAHTVMGAAEAERPHGPSKHEQDGQENLQGVSMPPQGNVDENEDDYCTDTEGLSDREAPGALCWKGVKTSENKGRHSSMRRRRRKGRFLLRLVPCAKGGGRGS